MREDRPVLEGETHGCSTEVLYLITKDARAAEDEYCFEGGEFVVPQR